MTFKSLFGINEVDPPDKKQKQTMVGKIYHLGKGWGFISSPEMEYTRIFFHWTGLLPNTLNFKELRKGMKVEFEPKELIEENKVRAIKVKVLAESNPVDKSDGQN